MPLIYETKGRAREFSDLAANLYVGCGHGCVYCYAPTVVHVNRSDFVKAPRVRHGWEILLQNDAAKLAEAGDKRNVLLSFVTDPYQPMERTEFVTRRAIEIMHFFDIGVTILTKAGELVRRDFDLLIAGKDQFATTLTTVDEDTSRRLEPQAGLPMERIANLKYARSESGVETWVSLEPALSIDDAMNVIQASYRYTGHYKVGKMNYHPMGKSVDWEQYAEDVLLELDRKGARYYVKKDLAKYLGHSEGYWNSPDPA